VGIGVKDLRMARYAIEIFEFETAVISTPAAA
jgi:hypothetical protein